MTGLPRLKRAVWGYRPKDVEDLVRERDMAVSLTEQDAKDAEARVEELTHELDELGTELEKLKTELGDAKTKLDSQEAELGSGKVALDAAARDLDSVRTELTDTRRELQAAVTELEQTKTTSDTARAELDGARKQLDAVRVELAEARMRADGARGELEVTGTQVAGARHEAEGLRADLRHAQSERDAARRELETARAEAERARAGSERLSAEVERLTTRARAAEAMAEEAIAFSSPTSSVIGEELSSILEVTEKAVGRIVQSARLAGEEELRRLAERRHAIQTEIEALLGWTRRLEPLIAATRLSVDDARGRLTDVSERVLSALEPADRAVATLNAQLEALAQASWPPPGSGAPEQPTVWGFRPEPTIAHIGEAGEEDVPPQEATEETTPGATQGPSTPIPYTAPW